MTKGPVGPVGPLHGPEAPVTPERAACGPAGSRAARILLIDDHAILREGLSALIALESDLSVVGHAASIPEGIAAALALRPDLIITDLSLPSTTGAQAILELRRHCPDVRVLVLTFRDTNEYIRAALAAGADGYVVKRAQRDELIYAIRAVLSGKRHLCTRSSESMVSCYLGDSPSNPPPAAGITNRERDVITMIAKGFSNKRIALALRRSIKTIEKHRANLMRKLKLHNTADVTRFALQCGLLDGDKADGHPGAR